MIKIGNLQVFIDRREIRSNGEIVRIGGRAFHILELLIKARGALVSKEEIMACVWPTTIVEENNLQVQIASIRRLLGEDRGLVVTVAGRGYHLSDVQNDDYGSPPAEPDTEAVSRNFSSHILVSNQSAFFGRTGAVLDVLAAICGSSIVTLVGSGGIGKTRLAVEVARFVHPNFFDSVAFISLAGVTDARFAVDAVADALGLRPSTEGVSLAHIAKAMTGKRTLMVLDNCEHLLDAASKIVEHLASDSEGVRILATSREPLRVREEVLYNVLPLEVPDVSKSSNEALQASAVQLFFSRAEGIDNNEEYNGRNISIAADVCRRLDGIPLAIELAASRASSLGLDVISARLDDRLNTLSGSPRTTLPRHQTLKAMLDWSYQLLDKTERLIFRWLGMFVDGFTFEAACRIGYINGLSDGEVMDSLSGLLSKSLVSRSERGRFRLLETTRTYAVHQLEDNGELNSAARSQAIWFCESLRPILHDAMANACDDEIAGFRHELGNVRTALDWTLSPNGDRLIGIRLSAIALPYLYNLSLVQECADRAKKILEATSDLGPADFSLEFRLRVSMVYASARFHTVGPTLEIRQMWAGALSQAICIHDSELEAMAVFGLWSVYHYAGEILYSLLLARRLNVIVGEAGTSIYELTALRAEGIALHYIGEQNAARLQLEKAIGGGNDLARQCANEKFGIDDVIIAKAILARVLWVQAEREKALELAESALEVALAKERNLTTCVVLGESLIPIALLTKNFAVARRGIDLLRTISSRFSLSPWSACCVCYDECLHGLMRDTGRLAQYRRALVKVRECGLRTSLTFFLYQFAHMLIGAGQFEEAIEVSDEALQRCDGAGEGWLYAELCRLKGTIIDQSNSGKDAEFWLKRATESANRHGARTFLLRAVVSLGKYFLKCERFDDAVETLQPYLPHLMESTVDSEIEDARELHDALTSRNSEGNNALRAARVAIKKTPVSVDSNDLCGRTY